MRKILLANKNEYALVDDGDFEWLSEYNWYVSDHGYAVTTKNPHKYMHRMISNAQKGEITDHINRDKLDNRRNNLRMGD